MNAELEERVSARTAELEASTSQLRQSEKSRSLALAAGSMGSWDWDRSTGECLWDDGQYGIFGVNRKHFGVTAENLSAEKVREGGGAFASTRGACAPQKESRIEIR